MAAPKDSEKFLAKEVKRWSRRVFVKHFKDRFENAADIYDYIVGAAVEKKEEDK